MTLSYYRCEWVHPPNDCPLTIHYEVDSIGRVPRLIEVFADGRRACVSTKDFSGRENEMPGINSLVEGSFYDATMELLDAEPIETSDGTISLHTSDKKTFETEWREHRR